ncbi:hypothetical protein OG558_08900 [Kribbella sp. NBC_01510]|uniref:restriction endonuclease subunit S n=1 Tax=Kribbella sp. NBC_01510 TaxID=2903581 RepID=UPI003869B315
MSWAYNVNTAALDVAPPDWRRVPAWTILRRRDETRRADAELLSVYRDHGVVPKSSRDDNFNKPSEDLSAYRFVRRGDLVLNKMKTWQGSLAVSDFEGIVSPAYIVCELSPDVDARFVHHLLRSEPYINLYRSVSKGIRPSQWDLPFDEFRMLPLLLPPLEEQRRIADFLDTETARLDNLTYLRLRQRASLDERRWAHFERSLSSVSSEPGRLRRSFDSIIDGPFGSAFSSDDYVDSGAKVVRLGNIGFGEYRRDLQAHISEDLFRRFSRYSVLPGDVLIAGLGDAKNHAGRACVAPPNLGPTIVKGKCFRARVISGRADPNFIALLLSSPRGESAFESRGSTRSMINLEIVKSAVFPMPSLEDQRSMVAETGEHWRWLANVGRVIDSQTSLVAERRLALITAAVTGQIDVATARGVDVS